MTENDLLAIPGSDWERISRLCLSRRAKRRSHGWCDLADVHQVARIVAHEGQSLADKARLIFEAGQEAGSLLAGNRREACVLALLTHRARTLAAHDETRTR